VEFYLTAVLAFVRMQVLVMQKKKKERKKKSFFSE